VCVCVLFTWSLTDMNTSKFIMGSQLWWAFVCFSGSPSSCYFILYIFSINLYCTLANKYDDDDIILWFILWQCCISYTLNLVPSECSVVLNKPMVYKGILTASNDHSVQSVAVCRACCATDRKQFRIGLIIHPRPFAFIATVVNGAVELSIGLRLIWFIHAFPKKVLQTDTLK